MAQDQVVELLTKQVMSPVRFSDSIVTLKELGVSQLIEIGPGKVLTGFIKKIDRTLATSRVEDVKTLAETVSFLGE